MKVTATLMYRAKCQRDCLEEYRREWHRSPLDVDGCAFQVYTTGKPNLQFNVTMEGDGEPTIKFEEQSRLGTFAVGVAPEDGATIAQKHDSLLRLDDPLNKLIEIFPDNARIKRFVECLMNTK